jgi:hypothetical protein
MLIIGVAYIVENVPLTEADMLDQMPEGVIDVRRACVDVFRWEIGDSIFERHMRLPNTKHVD